MNHAAFVEEYHRTINGFRLVVTQAAQPAEREAVYRLLLDFIDALEPDPRSTRLTRAYRSRGGVVLERLEEVVGAIEKNDLAYN